MSKDEFPGLLKDLLFLLDHEAACGISEIIRQRRLQLDRGYTPEHDRDENSPLVDRAVDAIEGARACDKGPVHSYAKAGALLAAEIDRYRTPTAATQAYGATGCT